MERRRMLGGAMVTSVAGLMSGGVAAGQRLTDGDADVARALVDLRNELREARLSCAAPTCREVELVRQQMRTFLKANAHYPEFIDAGVDVWERVYDWHVTARQPVRVVRTSDGRVGLTFMLTTIVLRPDLGNDLVGPAYDGRQP